MKLSMVGVGVGLGVWNILQLLGSSLHIAGAIIQLCHISLTSHQMVSSVNLSVCPLPGTQDHPNPRLQRGSSNNQYLSWPGPITQQFGQQKFLSRQAFYSSTLKHHKCSRSHQTSSCVINGDPESWISPLPYLHEHGPSVVWR